MKFFSLLAVLTLPAASAITAKEVTETAFAALMSGDLGPYLASFADRYELRMDFGDMDWEMQGTHITGENGFTIEKGFLPAFAKIKIYELKYKVYEDPEDPNKGHYDATGFFRDESGQRWRMKYICHFGINEKGLLTHGYHHYYVLDKIDAKSTAIRMLDAWIAADLKGFFAEAHKDVVVDTDLGMSVGVTSMAGTYKGHDGFTKLMQNQAEVLDFDYTKRADGTYIIAYNYVDSANDGKTAFFEYNFPLKYKSSGSKYLANLKAYFKVDDFGLVVDYGFYEVHQIQISAKVGGSGSGAGSGRGEL